MYPVYLVIGVESQVMPQVERRVVHLYIFYILGGGNRY